MRLATCAVLAATLFGCGNAGYQVRAREEAQAKRDADLRKRAAFDLDCAEQTLVLTDLGATTKGVEGCNQKATYVDTSSGWVMNTINGAVAPQGASANATEGTTP